MDTSRQTAGVMWGHVSGLTGKLLSEELRYQYNANKNYLFTGVISLEINVEKIVGAGTAADFKNIFQYIVYAIDKRYFKENLLKTLKVD